MYLVEKTKFVTGWGFDVLERFLVKTPAEAEMYRIRNENPDAQIAIRITKVEIVKVS